MRTGCIRRWAATLLVMPLLVLSATRASADPACPARPAATAAAKKLAGQWWSKAVAHYDRGQNVEAIAAWQCAYKLAPHPLALYNIGRSAVLAGKVALAVKSYEEYLRLLPNASNKAEVEATLRGLRKRLPRRPPPDRRVVPPVRRVVPPVRRVVPPVRRVVPPARRAVPPVRQVTPPVRRRAVVIPDRPEDPKPAAKGRTLRIVGWSTLGLGVALAALAGGFGALTGDARGSVEYPIPGTYYSDVRGDEDRTRLFNALTWAMAGVSAAAVATGVALLVVGYRRDREKRVTVAPMVLRGGAAVTLGGTF